MVQLFSIWACQHVPTVIQCLLPWNGQERASGAGTEATWKSFTDWKHGSKFISAQSRTAVLWKPGEALGPRWDTCKPCSAFVLHDGSVVHKQPYPELQLHLRFRYRTVTSAAKYTSTYQDTYRQNNDSSFSNTDSSLTFVESADGVFHILCCPCDCKS